MKFIAFTVKGLEDVAVLEIKTRLEDVIIEKIEDKRIIFRTSGKLEEILKLRTVDDIAILFGEVYDCLSSADIISVLKIPTLTELRKLLRTVRLPDSKSYSITVTLAKSKIKTQEIINTLTSYIGDNLDWEFQEFDHSQFDVRVFMERNMLYLSVRIGEKSLHQREYKTLSRIGSLRPSIAASMALLATDYKSSCRVVDLFCGSGTILCEAYLLGNTVFGSDMNSEAVETTMGNLANCGAKNISISLFDARKNGWPANYFDCLISNLPWDKQIEVVSITNLYIDSIKEFKRILKKNGRICVLVSKPELFIKYMKKNWNMVSYSTSKIGYLGQNPTLITAQLS